MTALYTGTNDPVNREKLMMSKEKKKTARVMALSRHEGNIEQKSKFCHRQGH